VISHLTDPNDSNSDDDGLSDGAEVNTHSTDPKDTDSDDDGLLDGAEVNTHLTNPNLSDTDSDNLSDADEINSHLTNPNLADTDSDGLNDGDEINTHSTDPLASDSSGDGLSDGAIVAAGFDPNIDYTDLLNAQSSDSHNALGYYSMSQLEDARIGSTMIEVSGGKANITMTLEKTDDIGDWSNPSTTNATIQVDVPDGTQFYRFKMGE